MARVSRPFIKLSDGFQMPAMGLGTFRSKRSEVANAVKHAIDEGYRLIDTAFIYRNEREIGSAIQYKINEGVVKREEIFLTTKLWCIHHEPSRVEYACRKSLENFGLDYINLYLMHHPVGYVYVKDSIFHPKNHGSRYATTSDVDYLDTWKAMEDLVKKGLVRSIGLSNFNAEQTERVFNNCEIKPVINQVECHIELNQKKLREFCNKFNIVVMSYSPLAKHDSNERKPGFLYDECIIKIGKKYGKSPAQVAIRYLHQIGTVPIPKSVTNSRITENIRIFDFELSSVEMELLDGMNCDNRVVDWLLMDPNHKFYPFNAEF